MKRDCIIWQANGETWLQTEGQGRLWVSYAGNQSLCSVELFCNDLGIPLSILRAAPVLLAERTCPSFTPGRNGTSTV